MKKFGWGTEGFAGPNVSVVVALDAFPPPGLKTSIYDFLRSVKYNTQLQKIND